MNNRAQKRAIENYRSGLAKRGVVRFELQALETDRDLIRTLARTLTEGGSEGGRLRRATQEALSGEPPRSGGILNALRCSPLVGADLNLTRSHRERRKAEL